MTLTQSLLMLPGELMALYLSIAAAIESIVIGVH